MSAALWGDTRADNWGKKRTDFVCIKAMAAYIQQLLGDVLCEGRRVESGLMGRYYTDAVRQYA